MTTTKLKTGITGITLNEATFHNVSVEPTLINFFFGNNGTGKTTIAKAIAANEGLTWEQGRSFDAYSVLVYNQDFINRTLQRFGNLPGVYTIGEENVGIQNQIAEATQKKDEVDARLKTATDERTRKEAAKNTLLTSFQGACWDKTKAERDEFSETQGGKKQKATFAAEILQTATPVQHDITALRSLYETAYDPNAKAYGGFTLLGGVSRLKNSGGNALMSKVITSSGDSPFAEFIKAIGATNWVRQGHATFTQTADGKCPYCQQALPDDFEDELASCFDEQYQQDIDALVQFKEDYASDMRGFVEVLQGNLAGEIYPKLKLGLTEYRDKLALLEQAINTNLQRIADKIKEPSSVIQMEDVKTLRTELNDIMTAFNRQIDQNNEVVRTKPGKKGECKRMVWELLAYILKDETARYNASLATLGNEIHLLTQQISTDRQMARDLQAEITDLNGRIVSTLPTITDINNRLRDSGFQGFSLHENTAQEGTYRIIRENGEPADNLSEGERNFIAFLYFYHNVRGGQDSSDLGKPKVVVIDDPVSSMDSSVLFIVSTLVREMIEVCHNNMRFEGRVVPGDYIKQLFVLTHNAYFHKVITYNKVSFYECVSFFVVKKAGNHSSISPCEKKKYPFEKDTEMENQNPVKNSYAALWDELREVDTVIPLLNVIFRILDYYFLQICGHDGDNLYKLVLTDHRDRFVDIMPNGAEDLTRFHMASAMLSYLGSYAAGMGDGLHYVDDCTDIAQYKAVFKLIFTALDQEQHYKMMMGENEVRGAAENE